MTQNPYESPKSEEPPHRPRPAWVRVGLWTIHSRGVALGYMWFSILAAIACAVAGFWYPPIWAGVGFLLAALWYWLSIRWVDQNDRW